MSRGATPRLPTSPRSVAMFSWSGDDGSLVARTGHLFTFARSTQAWVLDKQGNIARVNEDQPLLRYHPATGSYGLVCLPQNAVNECYYGVTQGSWTLTNLTVAAAARMRGLLPLALLTDTDGVNRGTADAAVNLYAGQANMVSLFVMAGTATSSAVQLLDNNGTVLLDILISWVAGVPTVSALTGVVVFAESCSAGMYRLGFRSANAVTTAAGKFRIAPARDASATGTMYAGGCQVEAVAVTEPIFTTGAANDVRAFGLGYWEFDAAPRSMTIFAELVDFGIFGTAGSEILTIGGDGTSAPRGGTMKTAGFYTATNGVVGYMHHGGVFSSGATALALPTYGQRVELRFVMDEGTAGFTTGISINGAAEVVTQNLTTPWTLPSAWSNPRIYPGYNANGFLLTELKVFAGSMDLLNCRMRR